ncbi:DUF2971 domain-containing protein [Psychrobacter urativorans]|uniref:DUF2971 domain-containing protein n=1 Tax=Psychrobacter urativorans TaxID=45610 RepID=UPI001918312D|nr:DUF2971 domain-containing protein [Psychrobacter urativorans]
MEILGTLDKGTKIQRYMDLSKFIHVLENKQLFMCRMDYFEDKLEGGLTALNDFVYSGAAEALSHLVNNSLPMSFGKGFNSPETIEKAQKREKEYNEESKTRSLSTVFGDIELSEVITYKNVISEQKKWLDISCWHLNTDDFESIAMWKIYGGGTNSVCITTTVGQLLDAIENQSLNLLVSKVEYINHYEDYYKTDHLIAPFIHKHKAYKFENEVRFIAYNAEVNPLCNRDDAGSVINLRSNNFINDVKVSPEAPEWFFKLIKSIFNTRYGQVGKVARSDLDQLISTFGN